MSKRVVLIVAILTHYRVRFHERVRELLAAQGIRYDLIIGTPLPHEALKGDTVTLSWTTTIPSKPVRGLLWQPALRLLRGADLVISTQENRLVLNYLLQLRRFLPFRRQRFAFFGHGRNFQARNPNSQAERWKRFWATKVDWWFGYTEETKRHVASLGFPVDRITVFNNAVDTSEVRGHIATVTPERLAARRAELGIESARVGVFVGGLYEDKRLPFLIAAAERIRARVPDFALIVAGGGEKLPLLRELAATRTWIKVMGPRFGVDKVELMMLGQLFMMPGLVGLGVVDAGAAGLPTATTAFPYHSPEIAYVEDGVNGVIVSDWDDPQAYADAIVALLKDEPRLAAMRGEAERMAARLTIEKMADSFAEGILKALSA